MRKCTPHQKIMRAAKRGIGLRLSADDVEVLSLDDAIASHAALDDEAEISTRETKVYRGYLIQRQLIGWCIIKDGMLICSARGEEEAKSTIDSALTIMWEEAKKIIDRG